MQIFQKMLINYWLVSFAFIQDAYAPLISEEVTSPRSHRVKFKEVSEVIGSRQRHNPSSFMVTLNSNEGGYLAVKVLLTTYEEFEKKHENSSFLSSFLFLSRGLEGYPQAKFIKHPWFSSLFNEKGDKNQRVSIGKFQFFHLLERIMDQSNIRSRGQKVSPRQYWFLKFLGYFGECRDDSFIPVRTFGAFRKKLSQLYTEWVIVEKIRKETSKEKR